MRTYQNLWNASKAALVEQLRLLEGKVILSMLILKEWSRTNNLRFYLNKLGGKEQRKHEERKKEMSRNQKRATKINETKKNYSQNVQENRRWKLQILEINKETLLHIIQTLNRL